jgi:hypothetical protein
MIGQRPLEKLKHLICWLKNNIGFHLQESSHSQLMKRTKKWLSGRKDSKTRAEE